MPEPIQDIFRSPVFPVVLKLDHEGFEFKVTPEGVAVRPFSKLPDDARALFRQHQAELRLLVTVATDEGVHTRRDHFRYQYEAAQAGAVPDFLFRPGVPYVRGRCFSCGDGLTTLRFGRCLPCALAWRLACGAPIPADLADALDSAQGLA